MEIKKAPKIKSTCLPDKTAVFQSSSVTVGDMKTSWSNFNESLYFRLSVIRSLMS